MELGLNEPSVTFWGARCPQLWGFGGSQALGRGAGRAARGRAGEGGREECYDGSVRIRFILSCKGKKQKKTD